MKRRSSYPPATDAALGINLPRNGTSPSNSPSLVPLDPEHPGFRDTAYRARRNHIAAIALSHMPGTPVPNVNFLPEEHGVWQAVWEKLEPLHRDFACAEFLQAKARIPFGTDEIPQLSSVNDRLRALGGAASTMQLVPVAGLVTARAFLGHLSDGYFLSTQYIRHHSVPLYTPEPDIVHELVGHATSFAHQDFVALNTAFGEAALEASETRMQALANLYWWTLEFGAVKEEGTTKAYGAGLLSSFGELERLQNTPLVPLDCEQAARTKYDPTRYQPSLFVAETFEAMKDQLKAFLAS